MERGKRYKKGLLIDYIHYKGTNEHMFTWENKRELVKDCDLNDYLDEIGYVRKEVEKVTPDLTNEVWKKIAENYSISNKGRVRNDKFNRIIKPFKHNRKVVVALYENGKRREFGVCHLVAKAFLGKFKKVVRLDGNCFNNRLDNLKVY